MTLQWLQHPKVRFRTCWHLMLLMFFWIVLEWIFQVLYINPATDALDIYGRARAHELPGPALLQCLSVDVRKPVVCWWRNKKTASASWWLHSVAVTHWGETSLWWKGWLYTWNFNGWWLKFILKQGGTCKSYMWWLVFSDLVVWSLVWTLEHLQFIFSDRYHF